MRMAKYRRNSSMPASPSDRRASKPAGLPSGMRQRQDLRDLDRQREDQYGQEGEEEAAAARPKIRKRGHGVWQLKEVAASGKDVGKKSLVTCSVPNLHTDVSWFVICWCSEDLCSVIYKISSIDQLTVRVKHSVEGGIYILKYLSGNSDRVWTEGRVNIQI